MKTLSLLTHCSSEALARICQSQAHKLGYRGAEADCSSRRCESLTRWLRLLESQSGRTCAEPCPTTGEEISPPSSRKWGSGGAGSLTEFWTFNTSALPNDARVSSLSDILEAGNVPRKYFLSPKACAGILRRAKNRGKDLPMTLRVALEQVVEGSSEGGESRGQDPVVACFGGNCSGPIEVAPARNAHAGGRLDFESEAFVAHSLRGEGFDASEDGTGRGTPLVPVAFRHLASASDTGVPQEGFAPTLRGADDSGLAVCYDTTQITSAANYSSPKAGDPCHPLAAGAHAPAIVFPILEAGARTGKSTTDIRAGLGIGHDGDSMFTLQAGKQHAIGLALRGREGGGTAELSDECSCSIRASQGGGDKPHVLTAMQVRRLTPIECHRLMGWPDDWCAWGIDDDGKRINIADGPQYKMIGNGVGKPHAEWIGCRIVEAA